ncbi:plasmid mobilization relaxosome protein MobC, partial [Lactobacillus agilis]|nr:plasmid mobilization relaxosome protein MobC [Ligilactobacillus agilis]
NATNNINQMSKHLNRNLFVSEDEFLQLINSLDELKKEVARVGNLKNN